jgi:hypothetical protein
LPDVGDLADYVVEEHKALLAQVLAGLQPAAAPAKAAAAKVTPATAKKKPAAAATTVARKSARPRAAVQAS